ncbi:MAG: tetratricopeptide repeat protein [Desulfobulbaceae bacterium]|nr:tetratricopeptide repeat protein [Desulfobulbaceae bacterium]
MDGEGNKPDTAPPASSLKPWLWFARVGAILILLSPFFYLQRSNHSIAVVDEQQDQFIGSKVCASCHKGVYEKWQNSHHDLAMAVATNEIVKGDFNDSVYFDKYNNVTSRFFREGDKYFVETEDSESELERFEITHTFGVYPLQQYLIPFEGGRLQCLNIAWDDQKKVWYRLPPYEVNGPSDWLHWTKGGQNWNGMCAECHSTSLKKNYDKKSNSYTTTWAEINVGCEACHGPGSRHKNWAEQPAMGRATLVNAGLTVTSKNLSAKNQAALCAPCHSRRFQLGDNNHSEGELLDKLVPSLLDEGLYYPDGQIIEEVYVYGSFSQSKMYQKGVRCSDCHDPHSLRPHAEKNELCLQCHRKEEYDTETHHFHKKTYQGKPSDGYLCVKCHMPGQYYMGIDYRPDHSLRVPRPDLSQKLATPNSCSTQDCHGNKPLDWVVENYTKWYGTKRKPHYGEIFSQARKGSLVNSAELQGLAEDNLLPAIVRATAISLLRNYPGPETLKTFILSLQDSEALIRYTALRNLSQLSNERLVKLVAPKLYDSVKAVRIEAASILAKVPLDELRPADRKLQQQSLAEYRRAMLYNSDFAPQRYNLGNLALSQGDVDGAKTFFREAIAIDTLFYPAKVNLAMQLNREGQNKEAEKLLQEVVSEHPNLYEISYSLGLLQAELGKYREAALSLGNAADGMPQYSRARYNQALAYMKLQDWVQAEKRLVQALEVDSGNRQYFITLTNFYLRNNRHDKVKVLAETILSRFPDHPEANEIKQLLQR